MHLKTVSLLVVVYLLALSVRQGLSLQCYTCIGCNDPFDSNAYESSMLDCSSSCSKVKANGNVIRSCSGFGKADECEEEDDNAVCICSSELCNSALKTQTSALVILSTASLVLLRKYLF